MPEAKKLTMPPEVRRIYNLARLLGAIPKESADAVDDLVGEFFEATRVDASSPDTRTDKREFWAGAHHTAAELRDHFRALRTGEWRQWPAVAEWRKQAGDAEGDEE